MDYQATADMFQRALAHHQAGATEEAKAGYQEILEQPSPGGEGGAPDINANLFFADAHNNLGVLLKAGSELRDAMDHFRQALDLAPGHVDAMGNVGIIYLSQGNTEGALDLLSQALELQPEHLQSRISLGDTYAAMGRHEEAVDAYNRALAASPPNAVLQSSLGRSLTAAGRMEDAIAAFRRAVDIDAENIHALIELGRALFIVRAMDDAIEVLTRVTELAPDEPVGHTNLGLCYQRQDRVQQAIDSYRKALALDSAFVDARFNLAVMLLDFGKAEEARELAEDGLKISPTERVLNLLLARCDREAGDPLSAIERLEKYVNDPRQDHVAATTWMELAKSYEAQKDIEKAEQCLAKAENIRLTLPQSR